MDNSTTAIYSANPTASRDIYAHNAAMEHQCVACCVHAVRVCMALSLGSQLRPRLITQVSVLHLCYLLSNSEHVLRKACCVCTSCICGSPTHIGMPLLPLFATRLIIDPCHAADNKQNWIIVWRKGVDGSSAWDKLCTMSTDGLSNNVALETAAAPPTAPKSVDILCTAQFDHLVNGIAGESGVSCTA